MSGRNNWIRSSWPAARSRSRVRSGSAQTAVDARQVQQIVDEPTGALGFAAQHHEQSFAVRRVAVRGVLQRGFDILAVMYRQRRAQFVGGVGDEPADVLFGCHRAAFCTFERVEQHLVERGRGPASSLSRG